ncbi:MAG: hypothetical protein SX243_13240 [Acidobacteriota bacterium]|nr:hypothetical protein [Acidobacteriota bacterium]
MFSTLPLDCCAHLTSSRVVRTLMAAALLLAAELWLAPLAQAGPATAATPTIWTLDDQTLDLAATVPGYGGHFYGADGSLQIYLQDSAAASPLLAGLSYRALAADYSFAQLQDAADRVLAELQGLPGVVFSDLDESRNRVVVGVGSGLAAARISAELSSRGLDGIVEVRVVSPVVQAQELEDYFPSPAGGIQVSTLDFPCTLGFNAQRDGIFGFILNSHCTNDIGGVQDTELYQPTDLVSPELFALEIVDPEFFINDPCPAGRVCRYSDAAFARYKDWVAAQLGLIVRTTFSDPSSGSTTIDDLQPTFTIVSDASTASVLGATLHKVGRTTGWTEGPLSTTCANVNIDGSSITLLCQNWVDAGVFGGDSGSPVFSRLDATTVQLEGILWGRNVDGDRFVYSPVPMIEQDLGALQTF